MKCPSCNDHSLLPAKLEPDLAALLCTDCGGALLSLLHYRAWLESHPLESQKAAETEARVEAEDSTRALRCPKCTGLMTKYRISAQADNRLDLCVNCYEAWMDSGEWQLLKQLEIHDQLPSIFSDAWQKGIRRTEAREAEQERLNRVFGAEFERIQGFKDWLDGYEDRQAVLDYLQRA